MTWSDTERRRRRHNIARDDQRSRFERDRDRILYSSAFHRLAGVTQIVRAGEADVFHTRQQHTFKVAQVGRRLAQRVIEAQEAEAQSLGVDPEVVEAACLAHDLGHPPFGHVGEETLNELVLEHDSDGYEGNAQTFRIITKLSVRFADEPGLDLTRATLAACLKYPWYRNPARPHQEKKWSAYRSEEDDFDFARQFHSTENKTAEAELMDWADDIAFSVHDLEDFHRCGAIPWPLILSPDNESRLVSRVKTNWFAAPVDAEGRIRDALRSLTDLMSVFGAVVNERYEGTRDQRLQLRTLTSRLIGRYIRAVRLDASIDAPKAIIINPEEAVEVLVLKQITRDYVISSPSLAAQQYGQQRILRDLFDALIQNSKDTYPRFLPVRLRYLWDLRGESVSRFAADCIASLTEGEATALHGRLLGYKSGSVLDPIVR